MFLGVIVYGVIQTSLYLKGPLKSGEFNELDIHKVRKQNTEIGNM